ncbi:MAG: hypothetical protein IPI93_14675 [Sphingobacteriaceae bacterium]|nr:hypothetical protein [Sphingobacteriaceae bacterium]MBK7816667.1 hypothetical protein [Sphingobacteriaceae bacterium]
MDIFDDEILNLFKSLHDHKVQYVLVGGFAGYLNGSKRITEDLDIWIKDTLENRRCLQKALKEIGLPDMPQIERIDFVPGWSGINLPSGFPLDIMTDLSGFAKVRFDECYKLANEANIGEIKIRFLHINQLIEAKKASGRPKDLLDVEELENIKKGQK